MRDADILDRINREYEAEMKKIDNKLTFRRKQRSNKESIKDLVRQIALYVAVGVAFFLLLVLVCGKRSFNDSEWVVETYTVGYGDTLWGIGDEVTNESVDLRDWTGWVMELNDLESTDIYPHQTIKIYVPKEGK